MRFLKPKLRTRVVWLVAITAAVAAAIVIPVLAIDSSTFDTADGNLTLDDVDNGAPTTAAGGNFDSPGDDDATDWQNAPNLTGAGVGTIPADLAKDSADNSFGQGTKEDSAVPTITDGSIPPNKSDLINFYVSNEQVGTDAFLYLAWTRANTLGTVNMDFELNHNRCGLPPDPPGTDCSSNGVTPVRSAGDILVTFDFSQGGDHVDLGLLKWVTSGANSQCEANGATTSDGCWGNRIDLDQSGSADGAVNDGWTTLNPIDNPDSSLLERRFGEAGINLTEALNLGATDCEGFASAYLKSRSSDAFTSAVKDFVSPVPVNINLCRPANLKVIKTDQDGNPLGGATFELYEDDGTVPGELDDDDTPLSSCTTAAATDPNATPPTVAGECSFAQLTGVGSIDLIIHEAEAPPGFNPGADQTLTVTFTTSEQNLSVTFENSPVPGAINIHKEDDADNPLSGAVFTLFTDTDPADTDTGHDPNEDVATALTCTTDSAGDCTIENVPLGDYWVVETTGVPGHDKAADQHVTIGLGDTEGEGRTIDLTFVDPRQHKVIVIVCHEGTNTLAQSNVTRDSVDKSTLANGATLPDGVSEAELCGLGGATYGGISGHPLDDTLQVDIGSGAHGP